MNRKITSLSIRSAAALLRIGSLPLACILSGNTWATNAVDDHADRIIYFADCKTRTVSYAAKRNTSISPTDLTFEISISGAPDLVWWEGNPTNPCTGSYPAYKCFTGDIFSLTLPDTSVEAKPGGSPANLVIKHDIPDVSSAYGEVKVTIKDAANLSSTCAQTFVFKITEDGGGWGDTHLTTVDGVKYDFQGAGEYVFLKGKGVEIQTRQMPISSQGPLLPPNSNTNPPASADYTGLTTCVTVNSAVAARVGTHIVSVQTGAGATSTDPKLHLWVDHVQRNLGPEGIDLSTCNCPNPDPRTSGRIVRSADEKSFEIWYAEGTKLVIVPTWWPAHNVWYLDANVYDTTASQGLIGRTTNGWLPEKANGSSVGPKPAALSDRYRQVYDEFGNSWRVTPANSLFEPAGTSVPNIIDTTWPRNNPSSCLIGGQPSVLPATQEAAAKACEGVVNPQMRSNCIADVKVTGFTGFADGYKRSEQLVPGATATQLSADSATSQPGAAVKFTANVRRAISTMGKLTSGSVHFLVDGTPAGNPVAIGADGDAVWTTSNLSAGTHKVIARYQPSGFGEVFRPSSSAELDHLVARSGDGKQWISLHAGLANPRGAFGDSYKQGQSITLDWERAVNADYSLLGLLGHSTFKASTAGTTNMSWTNLSANVKYYYLKLGEGSIFVNAGGGMYMPKSGSTKAGLNAGVGYSTSLGPQLRGEVTVNYHYVFTSGRTTNYIVPQVGVTRQF